MSTLAEMEQTSVRIPAGQAILQGELQGLKGARGVVLFAHGSGSSRFSPRNQYVAGVLRKCDLATLLMDLLTREEEQVDLRTAELRFNIGLLAERLISAASWLQQQHETRELKLGYFGASTGAAAALIAAARLSDATGAVVSRGGRPDLAGRALAEVRAPTLLIVGGNDQPVITLNQAALERLSCEKKLEIVPGATHLFEEPGTLEKVAELTCSWFMKHLNAES
jgi:putative phosphoribosyl transferase